MTPVSNRPVPDGYTEEWDDSIWNAGHIFKWSNVCGLWLDCERLVTVRPGQTLSEAYEARMDEPMWNSSTIFFDLEGNAGL